MKREVIEDDLGQTPEEGSSTDGDESYDGDGDQYHNRKEERFIDYYSVPRGRPLSEGKLVRKGIHLKSQDKGRKIQLRAFKLMVCHKLTDIVQGIPSARRPGWVDFHVL